MAWVNIGDVRFRDKLPPSGKVRCTTQKDECEEGCRDEDSLLLLQGNVPKCYQWVTADTPKDNEQNQSKDDDDKFWTRKETSCDVELDTIGTITVMIISTYILDSYERLIFIITFGFCKLQIY